MQNAQSGKARWIVIIPTLRGPLPTSPCGVSWCTRYIHACAISSFSLLVGDFKLWDKWVDASSSNVEFALKSHVPTLVGKVATLCSSTHVRVINLRSIVMGFGYKSYTLKWWWRPLVNTGFLLGESMTLSTVFPSWLDHRAKGGVGVSRPYCIGARVVVLIGMVLPPESCWCALINRNVGRGGGLRLAVATCIVYVLLAMLALWSV